MKTTRKILALVLCVMLMTAIVPAAYANNPPVEGNPGTGGGDDDPGTTPVPPSATVEKNLIVFVIGYSNCTHTLREQKSARTDTNTCHVHVIG
ncbi:MAG: hypothetical protein LBI19_06560, partial [Oscillospiraceae bacterium]|nr:hypothetical protein [Oscillospiraceae bacterium]